ncbi:Mrp/NBP35 family ATP-binding protein [Alteriqipengyuania lutimaris]|uniref:Iron-sulfur cluster carrier protein n=1 Tax=Alteriqipengyuania lutimaris TaxID=1538146 RepID=A0A395LKM9_9SPHN|nr:Mrp/NBP35 family ATP-binding protein [Alteriqipengyuania lutimaris]MBB3033759.1 ATP-binding protein involved in chromosome partitioning [Alteriqipengyuania lutimaris]RDS77259.1 chromosome partitioning protein ParA [Alteriqipengyuania lutimaris]
MTKDAGRERATELTAVREALGPELAERIAAVRARPDTGAGGALSLVVDGSGLSEAARTALEGELREGLATIAAGREIAIAFMGERVKRRIIAIGSGKGGVGKSTVTANLAVALKRAGVKVGVIDADIYGPSQPILLKSEDMKPEAEGETLQPVVGAADIPMLSMGHLVNKGRALAWRGPMAGRALAQLFEANWGDAEVLLVDLPPGTGDVQITMLQKFRPDGAVIVSTPQDLALADAARAGSLFDQGEVPILGLIENMAGYVCPHCGEASDPFGSGGVERAAGRLDLPFLGRIPLSHAVRESSDAGAPVAMGDTPEGNAFRAIAEKIAQALSVKTA